MLDNPAQSDSALESLIDAAFDLLIQADTPETARVYFAEMKRLIGQRSPDRIFLMEVNRRLRCA